MSSARKRANPGRIKMSDAIHGCLLQWPSTCVTVIAVRCLGSMNIVCWCIFRWVFFGRLLRTTRNCTPGVFFLSQIHISALGGCIPTRVRKQLPVSRKVHSGTSANVLRLQMFFNIRKGGVREGFGRPRKVYNQL